jgi:transposase
VSTDFGGPSAALVTLPAWPPPSSRAPTASACEPYRELIEQALARGRNAMAIWQDLVDDHGFRGRYASVRRFVVKLRGQRTPDAHPVIVTAPGEEGQVDYGDGPMVRHPLTGKYRRTRLFVFTLGYSRKSVRLLTFESSTRRWAELHEEAFRRLGGAVRLVILDNLREGVLSADIYDPTLNPLYRDVLAHYGAVALPCRVGHADRKGKVESAIGHTQATPLKGLRFEMLAEAQAYLDRWDARWADTRIHGTTKRQVAAMFAEERPALLPLQEPVVKLALIVDAFRVHDQRVHQPAQIEELIPVAIVARQPRDLEPEDGPRMAQAHLGHQPLKARAAHRGRARLAQILIDHDHLMPPESPRMPLEIVLAATALVVVTDLVERRLPHVDEGGTTEMLRVDLLATHRPLARRPRAESRPAAGDPRGARGSGRGCRRAGPPIAWRSSTPAPADPGRIAVVASCRASLSSDMASASILAGDLAGGNA